MDNNPDWSSVWTRNLNIPTKFHHFRVFSSYKKIFDKLKIKNPDVIELGCGTGELTARIVQRYGGTATLVDNNEAAFGLASAAFKKHNLEFKFIREDIKKLKTDKKYGIVHSGGLIEHFTGIDQKKILDAHRLCASENGYVLIYVPRRIWYYSASRYVSEKVGLWPFGDENPIDAEELKNLLEQNNFHVKEYFNSGRFAFALATIS